MFAEVGCRGYGLTHHATYSILRNRRAFLNAKAKRTSVSMPFSAISLIWDSAVMLNFPMVAQSSYYICIYVCHSQLWTPCSWPRNHIYSCYGQQLLIYLYNVLNSRFRLLPSLRCTCGGQFGGRLRQVSTPFSAPGPRQNPSGQWGCWAKWRQLPEKGSWCAGIKGIGV